MKAPAQALGLILSLTAFLALGDAATKVFAGAFAAPQLFALSSGIILLALVPRLRGASLHTAHPRLMALRAGLTVLASVAFFAAFGALPLADVFLFVALIPMVTAALSGPCLNEPPRPRAWGALALGAFGVVIMLPGTPGGVQAGHLWAAVAALSGAGSILAGRAIARAEDRPLAQVFWPTLALCLAMSAALPAVWQPMGWGDAGVVAIYAGALFAARYLLARALQQMTAHLVTPLMNLQFLWMAGLGWLLFADLPAPQTVLGMALIAASSTWLVLGEMRRPAMA